MRRTQLFVPVIIATTLLLAGCGSHPKADAAAEQGCRKFAQLAADIRSGKVKGPQQIRPAVAQIEQLVQSSSDDAVKKAVQTLTSDAQQKSGDIKSATQAVIKACRDSGVQTGVGGGQKGSPSPSS
jgi:outer membrane murein-binding lipoprotein Lpp